MFLDTQNSSRRGVSAFSERASSTSALSAGSARMWSEPAARRLQRFPALTALLRGAPCPPLGHTLLARAPTSTPHRAALMARALPPVSHENGRMSLVFRICAPPLSLTAHALEGPSQLKMEGSRRQVGLAAAFPPDPQPRCAVLATRRRRSNYRRHNLFHCWA
jgi:hypothetical protein